MEVNPEFSQNFALCEYECNLLPFFLFNLTVLRYPSSTCNIIQGPIPTLVDITDAIVVERC